MLIGLYATRSGKMCFKCRFIFWELNTLQSCVIYKFKGNFVLVRDILLTPIFKWLILSGRVTYRYIWVVKIIFYGTGLFLLLHDAMSQRIV